MNQMSDTERYSDLPLDEIQRELDPDEFAVFMETVGAVELPLSWTLRGMPIHGED